MNLIHFNVSRSTTKEQLNSQKRELSLQYHPDKVGGCEKTMMLINEEFDLALKVIENRKKRYEQICRIEEKALLGLSFVKPQLEPEIKKLTKQALFEIADTIVPKRFKPFILIGLDKLNPAIDMADIQIIAKNAFSFAKHIVKQSSPANEK